MFLVFCLFISIQIVQEPVNVCFSALNSSKIADFCPYVWPLALSPPQIFQIFSFLLDIQIRIAKRTCSVSGLENQALQTMCSASLLYVTAGCVLSAFGSQKDPEDLPMTALASSFDLRRTIIWFRVPKGTWYA